MPAKLMSDVSSPQAMPEHVRSITLIRHGRTSYNARHCFQGQIDIPLDEIGEWQVRQTAQALRSLYVESHPERRQLVVASDLSRAMATAHAFADPLGLVVHPDARVRERNFGEWEGKELAELERECPEDYRAWAEYRGGELRHGAETKAAVGERGRAALEEWSFSAGADTDLYVFSHGSWIAQTVQTVLGLGGYPPRFRRRGQHGQRALGAVRRSRHARRHVAVAARRLQSWSGARRHRPVGASGPIAGS